MLRTIAAGLIVTAMIAGPAAAQPSGASATDQHTQSNGSHKASNTESNTNRQK